MKGWHNLPKDADTYDYARCKAAQAHSDSAEEMVNSLTAECQSYLQDIAQLEKVSSEYKREANQYRLRNAALCDELTKLCNSILDHPKRDHGHAAEELLRWLEEREE